MDNLKELRQDRGYTQVYMAKEVGVSLTAYIRWEQGVMNPNEENEKKLREVLQIGKGE